MHLHGKQFLATVAVFMMILANRLPLVNAARIMEHLDRAVVAVSRDGGEVYVGWRLLGTDPGGIAFNVYRDTVKITSTPLTDSTNFIDVNGSINSHYRVVPVMGGLEQEGSEPVSVWPSLYRDIPLQRPAGGTTPDGVSYVYRPNDASVGDVDGDGQYEIILKWDPSNSKDNAHSGYTGNVYLDACEMDGTFLWRIDLGINIRAGAHYTQFMVYDLDSDGRAEIVCKTADGTVDGAGTVLGDADADWRNGSGRILEGPEYLSVFDGQTGAFLDTVDYVPPRGSVSAWGDSYGNRVDRFLACVAYLDGQRPSVVMCRGYYTRTVLAAWDYREGQLTQRWVFDSDDGNPAYAGQGNHNLSVADVDGDGKDEIVYGSCTIDDDGTGLHSTGLGHGDAMHVSDMDPGRPGLEAWQVLEANASGATFRDAATGAILIDHPSGGDIGRGCAAHIDARYTGYQLWSYAAPGVYTTDNVQISDHYPNMNFLVWWTGDLQRELLDAVGREGANTILNKWNGNGTSRLLSLYRIPTSYSTASNNGTKANPCLSGDLLGDWREEILLRSSDNTKLRLFTTTDLTHRRIYTLMHDPQYRLAIAWQNVGYNQPPHPGFYIGQGMSAPPKPDIVLAGDPADDTLPPTPDPMAWQVKPYRNSHNSMVMEAVQAWDVQGVEFFFNCTSGGGHDSGWQASPVYEDTGLPAGSIYTYTVTARDRSGKQNQTMASVPASCRFEDTPVIAAWDFEDGTADEAFANVPGGGSADTVNGIIMHGYNQTYGPAFSAETPSGTGLSAFCNGGQDGYTLAESFNGWSPVSWTIEIAVRLDDVSGWETVIGRDGSSSGSPESDFYLQRNDGNGAFRLNILTAGGMRHIVDGDFPVAAAQWYRLAVVSNGITITMYCDKIDGAGYQVIGSLDISAQTPAQNALTADSTNWTFGRGWYDGIFTDHITGYIDNIRFTETALPPEEFLGVRDQSPSWLYGDFSGNHIVNHTDFTVFTDLWLRQHCEYLADFDLNGDCLIGLLELAEMIQNWLATDLYTASD